MRCSARQFVWQYRPDRTVRRKLLIVTAAVFAALLFAEFGLRLLGLPRSSGPFGFVEVGEGAEGMFCADRELFWKLRGSDGPFDANRLGLRGWLPPLPRRPHDFRIACVGDSCTFGLGVRYEEAWGMRLERAVQELLPGWCVQAILAGLPGYSTYQSRVLYDREIAAFAPQVTIVYCGAWNDYVPAVGIDDATRGARHASALFSLRLVQLIERATSPDPQRYREALARGEAPDGYRVALPDYVANLEALVARARAIDSTVLLVLAPFTERNAQTRPIALRYREATRALATRLALPLIDAPRIFAERHAAAPEDWRSLQPGEWPCLSDPVHPTATGHRLIAQALLASLRPMLPAAVDDPSMPPIQVTSHSPAPVRPLIDGDVQLIGSGFAGDAWERIWCGDHWIRAHRIVDDSHLQLSLPPTMPAGEHAIAFVTARGVVRTGTTMLTEAPPLQVEIARTASTLSLDVSAHGPPDWPIVVWFGQELRPHAADTDYGPFWLAGDGRPSGADDGPFRFDRLQLPKTDGRCDARGEWHLHLEQPLAALGDIPGQLCFQALLVDPRRGGYGVFTAVQRVVVPR